MKLPAALKRDARVEPLVKCSVFLAHYTSGLTCTSRFNAAGDFRARSLVRFPQLSLSGKRDCSLSTLDNEIQHTKPPRLVTSKPETHHLIQVSRGNLCFPRPQQ